MLMQAKQIAQRHKDIIIHFFKNQDCWLGTTKEALNSHQTRERVGPTDETKGVLWITWKN